MTATPSSRVKTRRKRKPTNREPLWAAFIMTCLIVAIAVWSVALYAKATRPTSVIIPERPKTQLVYATHWSQKAQLDGLRKYLDQYTTLHPSISFTIQVLPANEYADKLQILSTAGAAPDIYQIHSDWAAGFVQKNLLDTVPGDIQADVQKNYASTDGVTVAGQIRGIPAEINDYAVLYNKTLFKQAGIVDAQGNARPPKTWPELVADATKLTKKDSRGNFIQYGFASSRDNDWQMVDPFLSLLFSSGGHYLSANLTESLFDSSYGVQALNAQLSLPRSGSTSLNSNFFDFGQGKVGLVISPPWTKNTFKAAFGNKFDSTVGVTPLPSIGTEKTSQYSWFTGVTNASRHKTEAWNFLRWFTEDVQTRTHTTRYGDLIADTIGTIPVRTTDLQNHPSLQDPFTKTFVDQLANSRPEPSVLGTATIKAALMDQIQAAWDGHKTAQRALNDAAAIADKALRPSTNK